MDGLLHSFPSRVRLRAALVGLVAASALVAGCLETSPREGVFACTEATVASDCPSGWSCVGGLCYREARDAGATDASTDAARPDGAPFDAPTLEDAPTLDGAPMPEDALEPLDAASLDASGPDAAVTCTTSDECDDGVECTIDACTGETCSHTPGTCPTSADHMVGTCTASGCEYACEANYHDLNGLPADGCEYACTWSSAVDRPDDLATDENCDGADGIVGTTIYVKPTGLATGDGTSPATAVNLARAVDLLSSGTAPATVLLAIGDYSVSSPIHPTRPFELYGGYYTADFRHRNANPLVGTPTRIVADAPRALEVVMVDGAVDGLILLTRNRTMAGESAVTVWVATGAMAAERAPTMPVARTLARMVRWERPDPAPPPPEARADREASVRAVTQRLALQADRGAPGATERHSASAASPRRVASQPLDGSLRRRSVGAMAHEAKKGAEGAVAGGAVQPSSNSPLLPPNTVRVAAVAAVAAVAPEETRVEAVAGAARRSRSRPWHRRSAFAGR